LSAKRLPGSAQFMVCKQRAKTTTACGRVAEVFQMRQVAASRGEPEGSPALLWPPGDLTRAMMKADGVTEAALGMLLRKIGASRARG
jgi:hypothetical protein